MAKSDNDDRRRAPRFERVSLVHLVRRGEDGSEEELATGRTLNLSTLGIRLGLDHPLPLGSELELTLLLGGELVDALGTVLYQEEEAEGQHSVGIRFHDLDPEARDRIEHFLHTPPGSGDDG